MSNKVILVDILLPRVRKADFAPRMEEFQSLISTYGGFVVVATYQSRHTTNYRTYIGSGKAETLFKEALEKDVDFIVINNAMKPAQIWNLQESFEDFKAVYIQKHEANDPEYASKISRNKRIEIWDRIDLILKIFEKHASTQEANLEIELAKLNHMGPRIYGMGNMLSKQGGGVGTRGGGRSNTEMMKLHLKKQEQKINEQLDQCKKNKALQRGDRAKKGLKTVAIVGYTNAGKSHTLSALTGKEVYIADKLFATLDTRVGNLYLPNLNKICLVSDTIGFIQDLPPDLINSFKSTLEETIYSDLILHVIDVSDDKYEKKIRVVMDILKGLKIKQEVVFVFNKIDNIKTKSKFNSIKKDILEKYSNFNPIFISAKEKNGIEDLVKFIENKVK
ncbi:MAG: GTPase HflX [Patescibacteria group bacterium]